jgi:hypothetical protein
MAVTRSAASKAKSALTAPTPERRAQLRRIAIWSQLSAAGVALLLLLVVFGVQQHERGQIRHGVQAFGVDLSGMSRTEARAALTQAAQQRVGRSLTLNDNGNQWTLDGAALGLTLDVDGAVDDAWAVGRHGWGPQRLAALWHVRSDGNEVGGARVGVEGDALNAQLAALESAINQPRVDPALTLTASAPDASDDINTLVRYVHAQVGRTLDVDGTRGAILAALASGQSDVSLVVA